MAAPLRARRYLRPMTRRQHCLRRETARCLRGKSLRTNRRPKLHRHQFPRCQVEGPTDPVPFSHFLSGAVPRKCSTCEHLFEGECRRALQSTGRLLHLDYAPCRRPGATQPVRFSNQYLRSEVEIPEKCATCPLLKIDSIRGFSCNEDAQSWKAFPRAVDWGAWHPSLPVLEIPGRTLSRRFVDSVVRQDELSAVRDFRAANPDASISEARSAYARLKVEVVPPPEEHE